MRLGIAVALFSVVQWVSGCSQPGGSATRFPARLGSSNLATLASSLQPGQWGELTGMNGWVVNGGFVIDNQDGSNANIVGPGYTDKAVWDSVNRRLLFQGSPHAGTARAVQYDSDSNTWSEIANRYP